MRRVSRYTQAVVITYQSSNTLNHFSVTGYTQSCTSRGNVRCVRGLAPSAQQTLAIVQLQVAVLRTCPSVYMYRLTCDKNLLLIPELGDLDAAAYKFCPHHAYTSCPVAVGHGAMAHFVSTTSSQL